MRGIERPSPQWSTALAAVGDSESEIAGQRDASRFLLGSEGEPRLRHAAKNLDFAVEQCTFRLARIAYLALSLAARGKG